MTHTNVSTDLPVNPMFKDRIFRMIFSNKKELLELYNAFNGTNYEDPESLEINTLENAVYMSMRNDISFLIDARLTLYEHQSTYNPNLPLRYLMYIADLYSNMVRDTNLYGSKALTIPTPKFIIFYNGNEAQLDRQELKLSDLFQVQAVDKAITECIAKGILAEFLKKNRAEARKVSIYEYNEEKVMRALREEAIEEGIERGRAEGREEAEKRFIMKLFEKGKPAEEIAHILDEDVETIRALLAE